MRFTLHQVHKSNGFSTDPKANLMRLWQVELAMKGAKFSKQLLWKWII